MAEPVVLSVDDGSVLVRLPAATTAALERWLQRTWRQHGAVPRELLDLYDGLLRARSDIEATRHAGEGGACVTELLAGLTLPDMGVREVAAVLGVDVRQAQRVAASARVGRGRYSRVGVEALRAARGVS